MSSLSSLSSASPATVRLADGRLARLRGPDVSADRASDLLLFQAGLLRRGPALDLMQFVLLRALLAIETIDGVPLARPPATKGALRAFVRSFAEADQHAIAAAYDRLNPVLTPPWRPGGRS